MHHGRGPCAPGPFVQVPDPNMFPPEPPGPPPEPPDPCGKCPPRIYRNPPDVVLEPGDNIGLSEERTDTVVTYTVSALEMEGATEEEDGESGAVPKPTKEDREKFLRGDGTWSEMVPPERQQSDWGIDNVSSPAYIRNKPRVDVYVGPTAQAQAIPGFVPGAPLGDRGKFLRGDGQWATAITEVDQTVVPGSANPVSGQAVATAIDNIEPVPGEDAAGIVELEPGDGDSSLDFDVP